LQRTQESDLIVYWNIEESSRLGCYVLSNGKYLPFFSEGTTLLRKVGKPLQTDTD